MGSCYLQTMRNSGGGILGRDDHEEHEGSQVCNAARSSVAQSIGQSAAIVAGICRPICRTLTRSNWQPGTDVSQAGRAARSILVGGG
jgi:hypothetical protein